MIKDFSSMSFHQIWFILSFFLAIISPGILILFLFEKEVFFNLESIKLILLAFSMTSPVALINFMLGVGFLQNDSSIADDLDDFRTMSLLLALALTAATFYTSLILSYFLDLIFSEFLITLILLELVLLILFGAGILKRGVTK